MLVCPSREVLSDPSGPEGVIFDPIAIANRRRVVQDSFLTMEEVSVELRQGFASFGFGHSTRLDRFRTSKEPRRFPSVMPTCDEDADRGRKHKHKNDRHERAQDIAAPTSHGGSIDVRQRLCKIKYRVRLTRWWVGGIYGPAGLFALGEFADQALGWSVKVAIAVEGEVDGLSLAVDGDLAAALGIGAVVADGTGGEGGFAAGGEGDRDDAAVVGVALDLAAAPGDGETGERDDGACRDLFQDGFHVIPPLSGLGGEQV